ncbi:MAG: tetratricopeptide repeat protein [Gammaproteobacteria bacterium]
MSLFGELKRRNVFRVAMLYVVAAWLVIEVAETVLPIFEVPDGVLRGLVVLLVIGIVPALGFAWIYELTPEGLKRDTGVTENTEFSATTGHRLNWATLVVAVLAISFLAYDRFIPNGPAVQPAAEQASASAAAPPGTAAADSVQRETAASPTATSAGGERPSVAVLPFANLSTDPEQEFFADGITEDILTRLAGVSGLRVISRTSVMRYKNSELSLPEIAAELGVSHVLEGSVRRAGDRVRITGQLIRAEDDAHLWADSFDRELADIFSVQTEIAARIAEQLELQLTERDRKAIAQRGTDSPEAYEYFLRARAVSRRSFSTPAEMQAMTAEAAGYLEAALELDPEYAEAWAGLAGAALERMYWNEGDASAALADWEKAVEAAQRAIRVGPEQAAGYLALGRAYYARGEVEAAREQFRRAAELEPDLPEVLVIQAALLSGQGDLLEALERLERAAELDPADPNVWQDLSELYSDLGEFGRARDALNRAWGELAPHEARLNCHLMSVALAEGDVPRAKAHVDRFLELEGYSPFAQNCAASFHVRAGDLTEAVRLVRQRETFVLAQAPLAGAVVLSKAGQPAEKFLEAAERELERAVPRSSEAARLYTRARIAVMRDQRELALDLLEQAIAAGYWLGPWYQRAPEWDPIRDDPRLQAITAPMNAELERMRAELAAQLAVGS